MYRLADETVEILESQGLAQIIDKSLLDFEKHFVITLYHNRNVPNLNRSAVFRYPLEDYIEMNPKLKAAVKRAEANTVLREDVTIRDLLNFK